MHMCMLYLYLCLFKLSISSYVSLAAMSLKELVHLTYIFKFISLHSFYYAFTVCGTMVMMCLVLDKVTFFFSPCLVWKEVHQFY
jgi:hypothetical protein